MTERTEEMEGLQDRFVQKYNNAEEKMACNVSALGNVICSITLSPHSECEFWASPSLPSVQVEPGRGQGGEQRIRG